MKKKSVAQQTLDLLTELVESNKRIIQLLEAGRVFNVPLPAFTYDPIHPPYIVQPSPTTGPFPNTPYCGDPQSGHNVCARFDESRSNRWSEHSQIEGGQ